MTWWTATSVAINNGESIVNVTTGDDIQIAQEAGGLIIGNNPPVEIKRTFLDGSGNKKIELRLPWDYGNVATQSAVAFPTDADLAEATRVLRAVGSDAVTFAEALAQVIGSTANTITVSTETSGDLSVVPYGKLTQQVQDLLNTIGTFGSPLLASTSQNDARNKLGLAPRITAQPTLDLDFTKGDFKVYEQYGLTKKTISQAITTTRSSIATYNSPFGVATVAANEPRIEYDPVTGEVLGLLCEEQRTNLLLWSEDFSNSAWNKSQVDITSTGDGFYKMVPTTENTGHFLRSSAGDSTVAGTAYSFWVDVKAAEMDIINLQMRDVAFGSNQAASFRLSDQNIRTWFFGGGATTMNATIKHLGDGVYRCCISGVAQSTVTGGSIFWIRLSNSHLQQNPSFAGDGTSGILIRRAQLEAGSFPTSYIKTEGSQVTRVKDAVIATPLHNPSSFTVYAILDQAKLTVSNRCLSVGTSQNNRIELQSGGLVTQINGGSINSINFTLNPTQIYKVAYKFINGIITLVVNGVVINSTPTVSEMLFQSNNIKLASSTADNQPSTLLMKGCKYFPRALSNQELIDLTRL